MKNKIILNRDPLFGVPELTIPHERKVIYWLDNHYENYTIIDETYDEAEYNPSFVDFLDNGYTIDQLKNKSRGPELFGVQDRSKPLTQKINDMKADIDYLGEFANQEIAKAQQIAQLAQEQQLTPQGDFKNDKPNE